MTARNLWPPGRRRGRPHHETGHPVADTTTTDGKPMLDGGRDTADMPRLTGCPCGCSNPDECILAEPIPTSCHACGALDWPARESLDTCRDICPMRQVA